MNEDKISEDVRDCLRETVQGMLNIGLGTSLSEKDLKLLGIEQKPVSVTADDVKAIRQEAKLSQSVFAKLLNVSPSSVRQWEQGLRNPSGSAKVLLELLTRDPTILNYRLQ